MLDWKHVVNDLRRVLFRQVCIPASVVSLFPLPREPFSRSANLFSFFMRPPTKIVDDNCFDGYFYPLSPLFSYFRFSFSSSLLEWETERLVITRLTESVRRGSFSWARDFSWIRWARLKSILCHVRCARSRGLLASNTWITRDDYDAPLSVQQCRCSRIYACMCILTANILTGKVVIDNWSL